jgi:hypothetical protein
MLLVVVDPAEQGAVAHSLSWLDTGGGLWLIDGAGDGEAPTAGLVSIADLRQRISAALAGQG